MARTREFRGNRGKTVTVPLAFAVACAGMIGGAAALASGGHGIPSIGQGVIGSEAATFAHRFAAAVSRRDCSGEAWPYFEPRCLRRPDGSGLLPVRIIAVDRRTLGR